MTHSTSSSSSTSIAASPPTGCSFHERSYVGGTFDWIWNTFSFLSDERLNYARENLRTANSNIYKDYEWVDVPHSPDSLFITDPNMINEVVSKHRDGPIFSSGLEFQYMLTQGTGSQSLLTHTDKSRHDKLHRYCLQNEFGDEMIKRSIQSIAQVAIDFVQRFKKNKIYNMTEAIPYYTVEQTVTNVLKAEADIAEVVTTITEVEKQISNMMLLHIKEVVIAEVKRRILGMDCFYRLEEIAKAVIEQQSAEGIIKRMIGSNAFSDDEIQSLTKTILFIGSGTTRSVIISAIYCLMRDQELQEETYNSIKDLDLSCEHNEALFNALNDHEELNLLLLEVLRLFPPVPFQIRNTKVDYKFDCNGVVVPARKAIYMSLLHSYRDERRWENPKKCDPSRFKRLSEKGKALNIVNRLNPFSTGHSMCVGQRVAKMTWKVIMCAYLQSFKIVRPACMEEQKMKIVGGMTLQFDQPLFVQLERR